MVSSRDHILVHHRSGTSSGMADALAEIDRAATPKISLIFFISPSTDEGGRIHLKQFMVSGGSNRFGHNSWSDTAAPRYVPFDHYSVLL